MLKRIKSLRVCVCVFGVHVSLFVLLRNDAGNFKCAS